jgi:hypothetical protein
MLNLHMARSLPVVVMLAAMGNPLPGTSSDQLAQDFELTSLGDPSSLCADRKAPRAVLPGVNADPHIAALGGKFYLYPTTDGTEHWMSTSFHAWSSPDLVHWKDEGIILDLPRDLTWANVRAWAPAIATKGGKYYYYFSASQNIGVATSDRPEGPFVDPLGQPLVAKGDFPDMQCIDPMVFVDDDSSAYLYWGQGKCKVAKLNDDMVSFDGKQVRDITPPGYNEGPFVHKREGTYYLSWSEFDTRDPRYSVAYGMAGSPLGPFEKAKANPILQQSGEVKGAGHHSIVKIPGRDDWVIAYHRFRIPDGNGYNRETCLSPLRHAADGTILPVDVFASVPPIRRVISENVKEPRTDLIISGIRPHLTTYGVYSQNGAHYLEGHNECGIGAIVPWAGKLWMVNYAPHMPKGSEHKLFSIGPDLSQLLTIHPESVGGTPAGRMIHEESNQLLIAHYAIDASGNVRVIPPKRMPIRVTAIARHLMDPNNMVYYIDMEGAIWEANVHTLAVKRLFKKPVPGWHSKGGYTSQGRLVISNNGEWHVGDYSDLLVGGEAKNEEERGVLAEWNGQQWRIIERRQYTEVTGPKGITGGSDGNDPIWAIGWDRRSLRLKLLEQGQWHTYLLPKAAYCNDAKHGWYTEWPRIREITDGRWMMDMHGMFFNFPPGFSSNCSAGITPIASHLRYVPDFCAWNGRLVLATDETSIQGNPLAGQPQSNLWFGKLSDVRSWGPASGYGGPWIEDEVAADTPTDPFLVAGFDRRCLHLAVGRKHRVQHVAMRASDEQPINTISPALACLPRVTVRRGDWHKPAPGFQFKVDVPVTVYLAVDHRGDPSLPGCWKLTDLELSWGEGHWDQIYACDFAAGTIQIPPNNTEHRPGSFGMPHAAFVEGRQASKAAITAIGPATVALPQLASPAVKPTDEPVVFTLQVDRNGTGHWEDYAEVKVQQDGYVNHLFPTDFEAVWLRLIADRDCVATAFLHLTCVDRRDKTMPHDESLFAGLANVDDKSCQGALLYAAKRNRNLRVITSDDRFLEFTKAEFHFKQDLADEKLRTLLQVESDFSVDAASVVLKHRGQTLRLPKGDPAFDKSLLGGAARTSREVESERHLANIHGTFYEVPLVLNGAPPAWNRMRPVASHRKQITDFCSWNGLLVLAGIRAGAENDGHIFADRELNAALWFGGIDDLWKLGKPVGRGGPWLDTKVEPDVPSDPYLMTGYDQKSISMSHNSNQPVEFVLEVDIDGTGLWVTYDRFEVPVRDTVTHKFPPAFSACWLRVTVNKSTIASAQLTYE